MKFGDTLHLSFRTLRSNPLRTGITIAIIALGITALIGIITAVQAMNQKLMESFSTMGANGFTIRQKERTFRMGGNRRQVQVQRQATLQEKRSQLAQPLTLEEAEWFKRLFQYPAQVSISDYLGGRFTLSSSFGKTAPTVLLFGADEAYLDLNGLAVEEGRNFLEGEVASGAAVCVLGYDVADKIFTEASQAVGREVRINGVPHRVLAVLKSRGSTFGFSRDNLVITPYKASLRNFSAGRYSIGVKVSSLNRVEDAMGEAEGVLRSIRKLAVTEESNFALERSDSLAASALKSLRYFTAAVTLVGFITLIGAAIGLMNIMLVAVAERTKEVGLSKAIGAQPQFIRLQFLTESVVISVMGAVIGIAMGIVLGNVFGLLLQTSFVVPWNWVVYGIVICTIVGLAAGTYPALKAGRLNPIEALRYE